METGTSDLERLFARQLAARRIDLPPMPGTASEVMSLCQQPATDAARLSAVVHRDQAIASHVLRVANSAAYVGQVPCVSLQQAITRLGQRQVSEIVMAAALRGHLFHDPACADLLALVWKHSVLTGFFTKEIARQLRRNVEIAFLCGLLHDVGKAVLLGSVDESVGPSSPMPPLREVLGAIEAHHVEIGVLLAVEWKLPEQIAEAISFHHAAATAPRFAELAHTDALADALAHHVAPSVLAAPIGPDDIRQHDAFDVLNVYPDQLDALLALRDRAIALTEDMR